MLTEPALPTTCCSKCSGATLSRGIMECAELLLAIESRSAHEIFGFPDELKVRSSMTLFACAGRDRVFGAVLDAFYDGQKDPATLELLE